MADNQSGTNIVVQGRIVWGGVKVKAKTNRGSNAPILDPKTGQPVMEYAFGLAIPKQGPQSTPEEIQNVGTWWQAIQTEAAKLYPGGIPPKFAWKFVDGDGRKPEDGSEYPLHYRKCFVVSCTTRIPLRLFAWNQGKLEQISEDQIKCGDFVQVSLNISGHGPINGGSAGLYVNPSFVARVGYGPEIVNTPDPTTIFGTQAPAMPNGASATPIGMAATFGTPSFPGQPAGPGPMAPPQQPPVQPNYGVLPPQFQQAPQGQTAPGFAPAAPANVGYPQQATGPGQQFAPPQQYGAGPALPPQGQPMGGQPAMPGYGSAPSPQQPMGGGNYMPAPNAPAPGAPVNNGFPQMPGMPQYPQY